MMDVALAVGVSHQTVSRVLNGSPRVLPDTRDRVLAAIHDMGYRRNTAARTLATNRSGRLGVITAHLGLHGPSMIANSIQRAADDAGYDVALVGLPEITSRSLRASAERLLEQSAESIIIAVAHRESLVLARSLNPGIPVVLVEGALQGEPLSAGVDQRLGARLATHHLLELGHQAVALVAGPTDWIASEARREGWLTAHAAAGKIPGPELTGDWSAASGHSAGHDLAQRGAVTAVFVANDQMALGVLCGLHEAGRRVPEDVSVVGFDDSPESAYFWPPLTTVRQDFAELGRRTVEVTLRALNGEHRQDPKLVAPSLVIRSSTRKIR